MGLGQWVDSGSATQSLLAGFSPPGPEEGWVSHSSHSFSLVAEVISVFAIAEPLALHARVRAHTLTHTHTHTHWEGEGKKQIEQ